jgi:hypothetical protein
LKNPSQKRAGRVAQGVGLEFKPQYRKKKSPKTKNTAKTQNSKTTTKLPCNSQSQLENSTRIS